MGDLQHPTKEEVMSNRNNVPVNRVKLIKELESAFKRMIDLNTQSDKADKKFAEETSAFETKILQAITDGKLKPTSTTVSGWKQNTTVQMYFEIPKSWKRPERDEVRYVPTHELEEIQGFIALLKLCDDEFVPQAVNTNVIKFLVR